MRSMKLEFGLSIFVILLVLLATRFNEFDAPLVKIIRGKNWIDPRRLHVEGEFVESNLGTAQELDGSLVVRMIATQYLFVPRCILVLAGVPVHLRITSADVEHKFSVNGVDHEATPGVVTDSILNLPKPGNYEVPCKEFCGAGHYAMRGEVVAVPRDQFRSLRPEERVTCAAR